MSDTVTEDVSTPKEPTIEKDTPLEPSQEPITKKDPKKVEQCKRLAMISKAAKEKKMREKIEAEMKSDSSLPRVPKTLLIGLPLVGGYLIYKWFFSSSRSKEHTKVETVIEDKPEVEKKKFVKKKFETLD